MRTVQKFSLKYWVALAAIGTLILGVVALPSMAQDEMPMNPMVKMAMDNMKTFMMMPEKDRMKHMQEVQKASLANGVKLFQDTDLGTNGQSCNGCHVSGGTTGGKVEMMPGMMMGIPGLHGVAQQYPKFKIPNDAVITLAEMNNNCLVMFQAGKPLPLGSREARDLAAYVSSLAGK